MTEATKQKPSKPLVLAAFVAATLTGSVAITRLMQYGNDAMLQSVCNNPNATAEFKDAACLILENRAALARGETFPAAPPSIRFADGTPNCVAMGFEDAACRPSARVAEMPATGCVP